MPALRLMVILAAEKRRRLMKSTECDGVLESRYDELRVSDESDGIMLELSTVLAIAVLQPILESAD